jgi:hypothetical protein
MKNYMFTILSYGLIIMTANTGCEETSAQAQFTSETGLACYSIIVGETAVDSTPSKQLQVDCPEGMRALGAGWSVLDETSAILEGQATYFEPSYDGKHWLTNAKNESAFASNWKLRVRLICSCEQLFK